MKITIYTITDCPFSKQEKEYLSGHGLQFEEKNLETNREFLTEMLAVGSNFAGTPVTKIEKDDGQIAVLKGFTPAEFDKTLGQIGEPVKPVETSQSQPEQTQKVAPSAEAVQAAPTPVEQPVAPVSQEVPPAPTPTVDPAMTSVLGTLEQQAGAAAPPVATPVVQDQPLPPAPVTGVPVIPDPQF